MKRWQVILDLVCDVAQYLNNDVSQSEQKSSKKVIENKFETNERTGEEVRDLNVISDLLKEHEKLQKTSDEDLKIMNSFLDSLANLSDNDA